MSYFPESILTEIEDEIATDELLVCDESSLWQPTQLWPGEVYRLVYLPTFGEKAVLRITLNAEAGHVVLKRGVITTYRRITVDRDGTSQQWLEGRTVYGGNHANPLRVETRIPFGIEEANRLRKSLADSDFWNLAPSPRVQPERDGCLALLEGRRGEAYQIIPRWLWEGEPLEPLVVALLRTAGWRDWLTERAERREAWQVERPLIKRSIAEMDRQRAAAGSLRKQALRLALKDTRKVRHEGGSRDGA